jgi:hypothetical protein
MSLLAINFPQAIIPALLNRFDFLYFQEATCVEYFIKNKKTQEQVSQAIVLSLNQASRQIHVSKFYPELFRQPQCKYLSAACFYLLVHHFASIYALPKDFRICLETRPETFSRFYTKLRSFYFHLDWVELCQTAHVCGKYPHLEIDVSKVQEKNLRTTETPFLI